MRDKKMIVLLSGEIAVGKSTLSKLLIEKYGFKHISTRALLVDYARSKFSEEKIQERGFLQELGEKLDRTTKGGWIINQAQRELLGSTPVIIDSVRIADQINAFRDKYRLEIIHIHLTASPEVLKSRFLSRKMVDIALSIEEKKDKYERYKQDATEKQVNTLKDLADLVVRTDRQNEQDNLTLVASFLKLRSPIHKKNVDIVIGGQFGSEGKGQIAGYLAPEYDCLIRVGGPNAGHKVYNDPIHTFHLIPSGSHRNQKAAIVIGPGAVLSREKILEEIAYYNVGDRIIIDENATIISQADIEAEQKESIGSTKKGVGSATANNLFVNRLKNSDDHKAGRDPMLLPYIGSAFETYDKILSANGKILLEGTQGTFLDLHHGYYPYVTSRSTIASGCLAESGIGPRKVNKVILVVRRYPIRVQSPKGGTSGPFSDSDMTVPEISWKEISSRSGISLSELNKNEKTTATNRKRRVAEFNWALFRKACELNTATDIAFSFADYISIENRQANRFEQLTKKTRAFIEKMEQCSELPVSLIARHFDFRAIIDRRKW